MAVYVAVESGARGDPYGWFGVLRDDRAGFGVMILVRETGTASDHKRQGDYYQNT